MVTKNKKSNSNQEVPKSLHNIPINVWINHMPAIQKTMLASTAKKYKKLKTERPMLNFNTLKIPRVSERGLKNLFTSQSNVAKKFRSSLVNDFVKQGNISVNTGKQLKIYLNSPQNLKSNFLLNKISDVGYAESNNGIVFNWYSHFENKNGEIIRKNNRKFYNEIVNVLRNFVLERVNGYY
jgi:hypothetical protein